MQMPSWESFKFLVEELITRNNLYYKNTPSGSGDMAQQFRAFIALVKDLDSIPSTYVKSQKQFVTSVPSHLTPDSDHCRSQACTWFTHKYVSKHS